MYELWGFSSEREARAADRDSKDVMKEKKKQAKLEQKRKERLQGDVIGSCVQQKCVIVVVIIWISFFSISSWEYVEFDGSRN